MMKNEMKTKMKIANYLTDIITEPENKTETKLSRPINNLNNPRSKTYPM